MGSVNGDAGKDDYTISEPERIKRLNKLTKTERRVFESLCNNKTAKQTADELVVSGGAVNFHRQNIYDKLELTKLPPDERRTRRADYCRTFASAPPSLPPAADEDRRDRPSPEAARAVEEDEEDEKQRRQEPAEVVQPIPAQPPGDREPGGSLPGRVGDRAWTRRQLLVVCASTGAGTAVGVLGAAALFHLGLLSSGGGSSVASGGGPPATPTVPATSNATPPSVSTAALALASPYRGQQITYYGDGVGIGNELDRVLADRFSNDTGIQVTVIPRTNDPTKTYALYEFNFKNNVGDVYMIDVTWSDAFAPYLLDLSQRGMGVSIGQDPMLIDNNTTNSGALVAIPWFLDSSFLYYNKDVLDQYNFISPTTWDELEKQTRVIIGAQGTVKGYLFQGDDYEGLTCELVEWYASNNAGNLIEFNGNVTIDNENGRGILDRVRGWVGSISPGSANGVLTDQEGDSIKQFKEGNAVFMRGWGTAYSELRGANLPFKFEVAPLPGYRSCLGGWQLAVSQKSSSPEAAVEFVRYMTSYDVQLWRVSRGGFTPTFPALVQTIIGNPSLSEAMPFLKFGRQVQLVVRPSKLLKEQYNAASGEMYTGVHRILEGDDPAQVLPGVQAQLQVRVRQASSGSTRVGASTP